jgi:peptidoglycan/xylan/chitin deacetylase (PgdA/CDA1 family)
VRSMLGSRSAGSNSRLVPILMYHVIAPPPARAPYPDLYVRPSDFAAHVLSLAGAGYQAITMNRLFEEWYGDGIVRQACPLVLSFDDGYPSHFAEVMPVLRDVGWPGVLNLQWARLGRDDGLSHAQVEAMIEAGWEIGSHAISHVDLTTAPPGRVRHELIESRRFIQREFGIQVNFFCYPSGRYTTWTKWAVCAAGYRGATTTRVGLGESSEPFELARVRVNGSDGANGVAQKLGVLVGRRGARAYP